MRPFSLIVALVGSTVVGALPTQEAPEDPSSLPEVSRGLSPLDMEMIAKSMLLMGGLGVMLVEDHNRKPLSQWGNTDDALKAIDRLQGIDRSEKAIRLQAIRRKNREELINMILEASANRRKGERETERDEAECIANRLWPDSGFAPYYNPLQRQYHVEECRQWKLRKIVAAMEEERREQAPEVAREAEARRLAQTGSENVGEVRVKDEKTSQKNEFRLPDVDVAGAVKVLRAYRPPEIKPANVVKGIAALASRAGSGATPVKVPMGRMKVPV
ncbi:MAG: hypothetical protein M1823_003543 [Watsoniomyces obsoletus]|nr:MAG: hypothetical protein M1823_003543 [Watsoniomyces obsoletus]